MNNIKTITNEIKSEGVIDMNDKVMTGTGRTDMMEGVIDMNDKVMTGTGRTDMMEGVIDMSDKVMADTGRTDMMEGVIDMNDKVMTGTGRTDILCCVYPSFLLRRLTPGAQAQAPSSGGQYVDG